MRCYARWFRAQKQNGGRLVERFHFDNNQKRGPTDNMDSSSHQPDGQTIMNGYSSSENPNHRKTGNDYRVTAETSKNYSGSRLGTEEHSCKRDRKQLFGTGSSSVCG